MVNILMTQPLFIGTTELLLIGGMALLLFGGKKLPEMMRGLGQGVREFKKGVNEVNAPLEEETDKGIDCVENSQTDVNSHESKENSDGK